MLKRGRSVRWLAVAGVLGSLFGSVQAGAHDIPSRAPADVTQRANPLSRSEAVMGEGKNVYERLCASCHGLSGSGDTSAAAGFSHRPSDFRKGFKGQTDGALFWKITKGGGAMPAYEKTLTEEQRWQVVHYLRTLESPATGQRP